MTITYIKGERVILKANPAEGFPEERGVILETIEFEDDRADEKETIVRVDQWYRDPRDQADDGLREVSCDQLEKFL